MKNINIMLIGCGPHAKRVYIPIIKELGNKCRVQLKAVVELKEIQQTVAEFVNQFFYNVEYLFVDRFGKKNKHSLPRNVEKELNRIVKEKHIEGVIISTDPLNHMQYALWAQKQKLHILMDKPISTYENVSNSVSQAKQLNEDYKLLMENYTGDRVFIINSQRRFLPQFEIIQEKVNEVAKKYGMPVTSMQSTHCDGQWRLPNEILTIKYHPLIGWGKVSHSGYHFIDMAAKIVRDSYIEAQKSFDKLSVFSKFIRPSGLLIEQSQKDLEKLFTEEYGKIDSRTDEELTKLYQENNEAEVDATSIVSLSSNNITTTNITLNLLHNGFSRRSWMLPNMEDLYKGNGRVRHEYHNIQQGCLQNIQVHSYQSSDKHDKNTGKDFLLGGNNHYDIYIFRNAGLIGGEPLEVITAKEITKKYKLNKSKVMNELARHEAVRQFIEVIMGKRRIEDTKANITDHALTVELMSMVYESGVKSKEITHKYNDSGEK